MTRYRTFTNWQAWLGVMALLPLACAGTTPLTATDTSAPTTIPPTIAPSQPPTDLPSATPLAATTTPVPTDTPLPPTHTPKPTATPVPGPGDLLVAPDLSTLDDWFGFAFSFSTGDETDNFTLESRHNALYIEVPEKETSVYATYIVELGQPDVQIDVDVETVAGPNRNNISLVCRDNEEGWYEFSIHSGGLWVIYRFEYSEGYTQLAEGGSTAINMQRAQNHLRVVCLEDELSFWVNEDFLTTVRDNRFSDGFAGVSVTTFDITGAGIEFSNFEVRVADPSIVPD